MRTLIVWLRNLREYLRRGGHARIDVVKVPAGESLRGRRVIVTGGSSGIGLAIARRCVEEGAKVVITGRDEGKLSRAKACTKNIEILVWDVSKVSEAEEKIQEAERLLDGRIDAFVNNAGISIRQAASALTSDVWDAVLGINLSGAIFAAKAICTRWIRQGRNGVLVNISSSAGIEPVVDAYGVSKTALIQVTRGWAREYASKGIRINAIAPGVIVGTEVNKLQRSISVDGNLHCSAYPAGRFGVPLEIAEVALFLLSDKSSYVYGQTIVCDGGATL